MLYELRRYRIQTGCMGWMHERMQYTLFPLFEQSGVPRPVGIWEAASGADTPLLVWMIRWDSFEHRQAAWAALYPRWRELRPATVHDQEFVLHTSITLMSPWPELPAPDVSLASPCDDLWIQQVAATQGPLARSTFLSCDRPVLERAGTTLKGGFDLMFGDSLPKTAMLMSWPSPAARAAAMVAYDNAAQVRAGHHAANARFGRPVVESTLRIPLTRASYLA